MGMRRDRSYSSLVVNGCGISAILNLRRIILVTSTKNLLCIYECGCILGGCFDSSLGDHHIHHLLAGIYSIAHLGIVLRLNLHTCIDMYLRMYVCMYDERDLRQQLVASSENLGANFVLPGPRPVSPTRFY